MSTDVPESAPYREVAEILRTFHDSHWRSLSLDLHGMRITVGKDGPPAPAAPGGTGGEGDGAVAAPAPAITAPASAAAPAPPVSSRGGGTADPPATAVDTTGCVAVRSPAIGAFWVAPSPGQAPFVEVGQRVAQDEQLAIVEVMKLMNPVMAAAAGEVVAVCADNAEMVEYDQVLFWIRPTDG